MNLKELENKLNEENLLKIYDRGSWKTYNKIINHIPHGLENVFGIMKYEDGDYAIYITDEERGGSSYYWDTFETLEEACDKLYRYISLCDKSYKEKHPDYNSK